VNLLGGDDTGQIVGGIGTNAYLWSTSSAPIALNFPAWTVSGNQLTGRITPGHAYVQNGTSGPGTDLNPSGFVRSAALATDGAQQVGGASPSQLSLLLPGVVMTGDNAFLWNGSASTAVNLNPAGFSSDAWGTDGVNQVGAGISTTTGNLPHALLWSGSASDKDLNPSGWVGSLAMAVQGNQEVGWGVPTQVGDSSFQNDPRDAVLWNGSATSYTDLSPAGFSYSEALGTNGSQQIGVGFVTSSSESQAFLWNGTADSAINLQSVLPTNDTWTTSYPFGIDGSGNVFGFAEDSSDDYFAIEWSPVPEPASAAIMAAIGIGLLGRRRRFSAV
jgi:hypothetical protein